MPNWGIVILKTFTLITLLFLMTKLLGKRQLAQFTIFEYISGIVLGGIVAIHTSTMKYTFTYGIISMFIWFIITFAVEQFSLKNKSFRDLFQGKSAVLIQNGKIMEDNLKKEGFSSDDLLEHLRYKDIFNVADVEFAVLEPSGMVNVLPKKESLPPTAKDLELKLAPAKEPQTVVMDGEVMLEGLANLSLNPTWLETELEKMNVSIENVFLGQVDHHGQLTVDLYDDNIAVPSPTQKPLLKAQMKKCQADLELFALATENDQSKKMYDKNSEKLQQAIDLVRPYLK